MQSEGAEAGEAAVTWLHFEGDGGRGYPLTRVPLAGAAGRLYAGPVPGRLQGSLLAPQLRLIAAAGVTGILCLMPDADLDAVYGRGRYRREAAAVFGDGLALLPIRDFGLPVAHDAFLAQLRRVNAAVEAGERLLVHCMAGCGRAGLFASALLALRGVDPAEAVATYRAARGCGPETPEQVAYVARFNPARIG